MSAGTEPFPELFAREQLKPLSKPNGNDTTVTRRRKSSGLGQEIRAGDTGAPAIATLDVTPPSPSAVKVRILRQHYEDTF
jgi:acyl-CoA-dependent ceramide synthase